MLHGHVGDTDWFHSHLTLLPSGKTGVFVSYNTNTANDVSYLLGWRMGVRV